MKRRPRIRELGVVIGKLTTGKYNAITDVPGVTVGHVTLIEGEGALKVSEGPVRTGVTAILPHDGNVFREKVTAAVHIINAFGKSAGLLEIRELGRIESPILLTNTLSVWNVADALIDYMIKQNPGVCSFNPVVCECCDSFLNDIRGRHVRPEHVFHAIEKARSGPVEEGSIGAGTGMSGFGFKAGIGTSSRVFSEDEGGYTLGALTLTNTGGRGDLCIDGMPVGRELEPGASKEGTGKSDSEISTLPAPTDKNAGNSIIIVIATDAPVSSRQLQRIARRVPLGLGRTGAIAEHGSGDFIVAFSTAGSEPYHSSERYVQETTDRPDGKAAGGKIEDHELTPLFRAAIEATEEAIINSILRAETVVGRDRNVSHGIPIEQVSEIIEKYQHDKKL
ncbi:MAG: P1 family peptidase [Spirochaetes bacterium]|nr:P1 family peptidase [Spirochaetota bacterium]